MDVVPQGVLQRLMLSKMLPGLEQGPSRSCWVHEAPPAAGTRVKQRRHSCSPFPAGWRNGKKQVGC